MELLCQCLSLRTISLVIGGHSLGRSIQNYIAAPQLAIEWTRLRKANKVSFVSETRAAEREREPCPMRSNCIFRDFALSENDSERDGEKEKLLTVWCNRSGEPSIHCL